MIPELYITNNYNEVYNHAKQISQELHLDLYVIEGTKEGINNLVELHNEHIKCAVLVKNVTKSPIFDILLSILEKTDLCIILISPRNDISQALISRCKIKSLFSNYKEEITGFINKKTLPKEITLDFCITLSNYLIENRYTDINICTKLYVINNVIKDIQLSTNNILQEELKDRLRSIL